MRKVYSYMGTTEKPSTGPQAQEPRRPIPAGPGVSEMTLRDKFAESVMLALLDQKPPTEALGRIPTIAYKMADGMIEARNA